MFKKLSLVFLSVAVLISASMLGGCSDNKETAKDTSSEQTTKVSEKADEYGDELKIISYNILVDWCTEYNGEYTGESKSFNFNKRKEQFVKIINEEKPDSFGIQEASLKWRDYLVKTLSDYSYVGTFDTDKEEASAFGTFIFYRKDKYDVVETKNFWLTKTPDKVSTYPGADRPRNGVWAVLKNKTTDEAYAHVNTHVEWKTKESNSMGASVVRSVVDSLSSKGYSVFCTGDFNVEHNDYEAVGIMTEKRDATAQVSNASDVALEGKIINSHFDFPDWPIDYIFVTNESIRVNKISNIGDYTISDHLGIITVAQIKK